MQTRYFDLRDTKGQQKEIEDKIGAAAKILRDGGLVGIPTETVYGLGANALDGTAVKRIFEAKGRPQDNPLIIHVTGAQWLPRYCADVPPLAYVLARKFWPGPLTMILKRRPIIPDETTAGLDTVAVRCPNHPVTLAIIREAGIVGMGGATFPTDIKAVTAQGRGDTILVNACECEPYITADDALLCSYPEQIFRGLAALDAALHPDRRVIAVEDNKSEAIAILRRHLPDWPGVELAVLPTRYPQGAEKQLIQAVTGRQVPPGHLPFSVGCAVFNAGTVAAVYRAVYEGKPVTKRIVTVTGEGVKEPKNLIVRIGTPFAQVIEAAGGLTEDACKVLSGGPMMGTAQGELAAPVLKGTNAVLCLTSANPTPERPVCIRCSKCVEVCPMHLQPLYLYRYEAAGNLDALQALHVTDCIECGCCSYTCPGQLPLTERFRAAKQALKEGIRP